MTKTLNTTFSATLLAASVFGPSAALAGDDYYQGVSPQQVQNHQIDRTTTQSIGNGAVKAAPTSAEVGAAQGDYYQGVSKHQ